MGDFLSGIGNHSFGQSCKQCWLISVALIALNGSVGISAFARPKLDIVFMTNGDRLTCEIKRLEYGQLHVKTEYALGTVVLDWEKIERVESSQRFVVETANGDYHTGLLRREASTSAAKAEQLEVVDNDVTTWLQHQETVQIEKLERSLIGKLDVKVDDERLHLYQGEQSNPVYLAGESGSEF